MSIYINTLKDLDFIRIGLASPEKVESWSHGEVKKPETINYRTLKPEKDGLFCERIFGTTKDWECACGKYKKSRFRGVICDKCGVEVTKSKVRRERMGHIKLAAPVCHIWYFKGIPSRISALLELTNKEIERILYYITYIITELDEEAISAHKPAIIDAVQKELEIIRNPDKGIETSVKYSFPRVMLDEFGLGDQYIAEPIKDAGGKTLFSENTIIDMDVVKRLIKEKVESLKVKMEKDAEDIEEVSLIRSFEIHLKKFHPLEDIVDEETGEVIASPDDKGFTTDAVTRMFYSGKSYTLLSKRMKMKLEKRVKDDEEKESQLEQGILLIDQLKKRQLLSEQESRWLMRIRAVAFKHRGLNLGEALKFEMGASAIQKLLRDIDLKKGFDETWELLSAATGAKKVKLTKKLKILKHFLDSGNRPEWMIIENLPVIPPELRPMVQLEGGRFAASDINDLYRRVINRNNRLKRLIEIRAPESIIKNEKRMLQEAVDALIDNGRRGKPIVGSTNRPLKSLSDLLKGKQGRFRQNLLGKRVDYSGRSVIVVGPELKLGQCGLPKVMALELFKPFVLKKLEERGLAMNIRAAKGMIERADSDVWDVLEEVIQGHPVLLNRAPTLHRLGVQAFIPTLVEGKAIQIHPLVCAAFNADFDGDQMAVHVPLSLTAQAEAKVLMMASNNLLLPADGKPIATPSHDMVLGLYFMTIDTMRQMDDLTEKQQREVPLFANAEEVVYAWETGQKHIHDYVRVRVPHEMLVPSRIPGPGDELVDNDDLHTRPMVGNIVLTTVGRLLVNRALPVGAPYYNLHIGKGRVRKIIAYIYATIGRTATVEMLDQIKEISFEMATAAGITIGMDDMQIPEAKAKIIEKSEKAVLDLVHRRKEGKLTEKEKYDRSIKIWTQATDDVSNAMMDGLDPLNPIYMMAISGARGKIDQMRQLAAMRGLMADPSGRTIEIPITSNFMEGLTVLEYFTSTHGARKGLADTALRTADSGYLTRRLVDVAQDILVTEDDCGTEDYIILEDMQSYTSNRKGTKGKIIEPLSDRVLGRISAEDFVDPKTGELIVARNQMINEERVRILNACGFKRINVRSILTCESSKGVCRKCYGRDLATGDLVDQGEPIGIVAAQAIGEPGTQLTMRTFHTGGVAGFDITQGLPHVELLFELFDARYQRKGSTVTPMGGTVSLADESGMLVVYPEKMTAKEAVAKAQVEARKRSRKELGDVFVLTAEQLHGKVLCVEDGEKVEIGDPLTEGDINPRDFLRYKGIREAERFMVSEVQKIYKNQGVNTNDKHIEVIIRQMLKYQQIADPRDSEFLEGDLVNRFVLAKYARGLKEQGLKPPEVVDLLLGISKASLKTESFLSAASFQETTKVLSNAAVEGRIDRMVGLKENVIIGRLVPVGTGQPELKNLSPLKEGEEPPAMDVTRDDISIAEIIDRAEAQTSETIVPPAE